MYLLFQYCSSSHCRGLSSIFALCALFFLQKYKERMKEGNRKQQQNTTSKATTKTATKTIKSATINLKMQLQTKLANWPLFA